MHTMNHNIFSDMTNEEFSKMLGFDDYRLYDKDIVDYPVCNEAMDSYWNWQDEGAVNDAKF